MSAFAGLESQSGFALGCRVRDQEGFRATVRYIGPVAAAKNKEEVWLGVEWDDNKRGKHDGSCVDDGGVMHRYFDCVFGAGSFVKMAKVTTGRSLVEALQDRYVSLDAPVIAEENAKLPDAFVTTSKGNQKSIEFYGEKKIRQRQQLENLDKVSARNDTISSIGEGLANIASHMVEIDLQDNLLWRWDEVIKLGVEVPAMTALLLHGNKMEPITPNVIERFPSNCFSNLKVLALNGCNIKSWAQIQLLEPLLPNLEELYLANNELPDLPRDDAEQSYRDATGTQGEPLASPVKGFTNLRVLDMAFCQLDEWSQVQAFGSLPNLQELVLDGNPLTSIVEPAANTFSTLYRISLASTRLESWSDIDTLSSYPQLLVLRLSSVPLFAGKGASEVRPFVIARVAKLLSFNGSQIGPRERSDADKIYLRSILREKAGQEAKHEHNNDELEKGLALLHPRYKELFVKYGEDVAPSAQANANSSLSSDLINVVFKNLSFGSGGTLEPISKKIPKSLTISKLKLMVKQLYGLEPRLQQLSLRVYKDAPPTLLDDDQSTLQYFGALDGADIFINEDKA